MNYQKELGTMKVILKLLMLFYFIVSLVNVCHSEISFIDSGQSLGNSNSWSISLVDLDGDHDLDAYFDNQIWLNDGNGFFQSSHQSIGGGEPSFGDLNKDGYIDAVAGNNIYLNDGQFNFIQATQSLTGTILSTKLVDLDKDNDLDIIAMNETSDWILYNDGHGNFISSGISLGGWAQAGYAVGDFDGDQDNDVFVAIPHNPPPPPFLSKPDIMMFGDSSGAYTQSTQSFPARMSRGVATGDIDNDNYLDLLIGDQNSHVRLWLNDGNGRFVQNRQRLSHTSTWEYLADFDNDGYLDAFITRGGPLDNGKPNEIWVNDEGQFSNSGLQLGQSNTVAAAFGDIDNDGDIDAITANVNLNTNEAPNKVYFNTTIIPTVNEIAFEKTSQSFGNYPSWYPIIANFDCDDDLDLLYQDNLPQGNAYRLWLNQRAVDIFLAQFSFTTSDYGRDNVVLLNKARP
jgi:hypothetical protein